MYERLDPSTARGRDSKRLFDSDSVVSKIPLPPAGDVQKVIANLQSMLSKPHIQPIEIEYRKHGRPEWYELYGGPANLRVLAEHLQRGGEYEILYRQWSTNAHAQDFLPFLARTSTGDSSIRRLRDTGPLKQIASFASTFVLGATRRVLAKYRPGEDFATWYMQEIQARYLVVTGGNRP